MRTLVTGAAGFIGSHVCDRLLESGHTVHGIDDLSTGHRFNLSADVTLFVEDVTAAEAQRIATENSYDAVFHLAARPSVQMSAQAPIQGVPSDVQGTVNMLEGAMRGEVPVFVLASTGGALYGDPVHTPQRESHVIAPECPYGASKRASEVYAEMYERVHGMRVVSLRYGNVYGPRARSGAVYWMAKHIFEGMPVEITGDGTQTRDYVHIDDVVDANAAALASEEASGAFNIATGRETDVNTLAWLVHRAAGLNTALRAEYVDAKPGEQMRSVLCCARARRVLGWTPGVALEDGLPGVHEWLRTQYYAV